MKPGELGLPPVSRWQLRLFSRYVAFYLRRHFHGLHLWRASSSLAVLAGKPVLVCLNHPSWWDPLLALYLSQVLFRERMQYAPIASVGLEKYRIFERFGFFGIDPQSSAGARRFLAIGKAVLALDDGVLWVTAQGHFTDVRIRPVALAGGIGHLAHLAEKPFYLLPLALEYAFWEERTPEAFAAIGEPLLVANGSGRSPADWTTRFAAALTETQHQLSCRVMARNARAFEPLIRGRAGVGGVYDLWRACKALARGRRFRSGHGEPVS